MRLIGVDGRPYNVFYDMAELDLADSHDGHSPDAKCITACYARSLALSDIHKHFLFNGDWTEAIVHMTFDGATVMLGEQNGVAARLQRVAPQAIATHASAHVTQVCRTSNVPPLQPYPLCSPPLPPHTLSSPPLPSPPLPPLSYSARSSRWATR